MSLKEKKKSCSKTKSSLEKLTTIDNDNPEFGKALQIVQYTNQSLFLTGKAGTGKSTFLRHVCATTKKKHVVLAPTGIAAINVGGTTLHSFFKIPFHPLLPNDNRFSERNIRETLKYTGAKRKIIRDVELVIIDEISMVRADIIDFIDKVLRVYTRNHYTPFGGKQMLFVGDIFQLEPVVRDEDRQLLRPFYPSQFFFDAHVFRQFQLISIELTKVYRQNDPSFITLLDHIRTNSTTQGELSQLNCRVGQQVNHEGELSITLSTRRDTVDYINEQQLDKLPGEVTCLHGEVEGDFPTSNLPTLMELYVKVGAQVIFLKNDFEHRWVNGTLGTITAIDTDEDDEEILTVLCDNGEEYEVTRDYWSNMRYTYNEKEEKIEEEEIGRFIQFPLRLAWAITVHKSQGMTFNHVNIDLSGGAFAGGQTYVALSRCRSMEGICLAEPIRMSDIFVRSEVVRFSRNYNNERLVNAAIESSQADKEYHDAVVALNQGDAEGFMTNFFKAIHHRYDIEKPREQRFIRRKLNQLLALRKENEQLLEERARQQAFLRKLAAEYTLMGKDCEREGMPEAAISNYRKALELSPESKEPLRRLQRLEKGKKTSR